MSSSGLIYAVIVGAWAAYLVPMWLRRQDELNEARPTERFSTAIRLLSGRGAMERRYAARARESEQSEADESQDNVDVRGLAVPATEITPPEHPPSDRADRAERPERDRSGTVARAQVLARRRRITSLLFLAFTAGAVAAAVGGLDLLWAPAGPGILLTLYIAHLRRAERRRFEFTMDQRRATEAARRLRDRPPAPRPSGTTADRRALVEQTDHAEWVDQAQLPPDDGWEPVPVPLPTYVTAPVAPRAHVHGHGHVDLAEPAPWSPSRSTPSAPSGPSSADRAPRDRTPLFDQYAPPPLPPTDPLDRPRAANE